MDQPADFFVGGSRGAPLRTIARIGFQVTAGAEGVEQERGQALEITGRGDRMFLRFCRGLRITGKFVQAHGDSLAKVHGAVLFARRDADEPMAVAEVFVREASFLRTEEESHTASGKMLAQLASGLFKTANWVLQLPKADSSGSDYESAVFDGFGDRLELFGFGKQRRGSDGRTRFAEREFVGVHYPKMGEAEVAHGAGSGADVERIARGDENDPQAVGFGIG